MTASSLPRPPAPPTLSELPPRDLAQALAGEGVWLDLGAASVHVRSDSPSFPAQLQAVYGGLPFITQAEWADVRVAVRQARGLRRWLRPQVTLWCDGQQPFEPFPDDSPLPMFEWGCNWQLAHRLNHLLLLHAGTLERDGLTLLLPATPGSGKSTLTAALSQRGWRLLSDEFGAYDLAAGAFRALLKPVALKNQSIEVMRAYAPQARWGPEFPKTRKGRVAHLAPLAEAVQRRHETARPGAIVLPKWEAGSPTRWEALEEHVSFPALAFNAFNYTVIGAAGFQAAVQLVRSCPAWQLIYSDLDDALAHIDAAWPEVRARHAQRSAA